MNPDRPYGLSISASAATPPAPTRAPGAFADIAAVNDGAAQRRAELFATLQAVGVDPWTNEPLPRMAAQPGDDFADEPMEASVA